ncbi:hypothetical protein BGX30_014054 [Mortierella sp. GBA39]|nr:hypothetical protein BGX30_014054 [Mortierella sp. GBA39]
MEGNVLAPSQLVPRHLETGVHKEEGIALQEAKNLAIKVLSSCLSLIIMPISKGLLSPHCYTTSFVPTALSSITG